MHANSRRALSFLSHGALVAAGFVIYSRCRPPASAPLPAPSAVTSGKSHPRETAPNPAVEAILQSLLPKPGAASATDYEAAYRQYKIDAVKLMHELPEEADLVAALDREIAAVHPASDEPGWKPSAKVAALLYRLLLKDPSAVEGLMNNTRSFAEVLRGLEIATAEAVKTPGGLEKILAATSASSSDHTFDVYLAGIVGPERNPEQVAQIKAAMPPAEWDGFCQMLAGRWPKDQRDELLAFAREENQPKMLARALDSAYGDPAAGDGAAAWLTKTLADPTLPADFHQALVEDKTVGQIIAADSAAPLALRVQFAEGSTESEKYATLCHLAVNGLSAGEINWKGLVHSGDATAAEVLAAVSESVPELAGAAPEELRDQLFAALAGENAAAALKLLDGLPGDQRSQTMLDAARSGMRNASPDAFLAFLQQVPDDTPALWDGRLDAWNRSVDFMTLRNGSDFTDWVQSLPPGTDREMALYALAGRVQSRNGDLAAELRSQVTDPKLRQMIAEKR